MLMGGSALASVWLLVENKKKEKQGLLEQIRLDSIEIAKTKDREVENLVENMLVSQERKKIIDTLLSGTTMEPIEKTQILEDLKEHNVVLTAIRCDMTAEDSLRIDEWKQDESLQSFPLEENTIPASQIARNLNIQWKRKGKIKSKNQLVVSFEYLQPHVNDTIPIYVILKSEDGNLLDCIKKCPANPEKGPAIYRDISGKKIQFQATIEPKETMEKPALVLVVHANEGLIGHAKIKRN